MRRREPPWVKKRGIMRGREPPGYGGVGISRVYASHMSPWCIYGVYIASLYTVCSWSVLPGSHVVNVNDSLVRDIKEARVFP